MTHHPPQLTAPEQRPLLHAGVQVLVEKSKRCLTLTRGGTVVLRCRVGLGSCPVGRKRQQGDGKTPEGVYAICLIKEQGKYGRSLGISYPGRQDAEDALREGRIDLGTHQAIVERLEAGERPPWGSPLGGEIYIHEGGSQRDWTAGCVALDERDMDVLFPLREQIVRVEIRP